MRTTAITVLVAFGAGCTAVDRDGARVDVMVGAPDPGCAVPILQWVGPVELTDTWLSVYLNSCGRASTVLFDAIEVQPSGEAPYHEIHPVNHAFTEWESFYELTLLYVDDPADVEAGVSTHFRQADADNLAYGVRLYRERQLVDCAAWGPGATDLLVDGFPDEVLGHALWRPEEVNEVNCRNAD